MLYIRKSSYPHYIQLLRPVQLNAFHFCPASKWDLLSKTQIFIGDKPIGTNTSVVIYTSRGSGTFSPFPAKSIIIITWMRWFI